MRSRCRGCVGGRQPPSGPCRVCRSDEQVASARAASIISAHTTGQIISVVTVHAADQPAVVAVALAVVSDVLKRPAVSSTR
jgi:hypothetical protein